MKRMTRRGLIASSVSLGTAVVLAESRATPGEASSSGTSYLTGTLREIQGRKIVVQTDSGAERVLIPGNARVNRDGPARLSDFRLGESVVVELSGRRADAIELRYGLVQGAVTAASSSLVETTGGTIVVDTDTIIHAFGNRSHRLTTDALVRGVFIAATTRRDPATGARHARLIAV